MRLFGGPFFMFDSQCAFKHPMEDCVSRAEGDQAHRLQLIVPTKESKGKKQVRSARDVPEGIRRMIAGDFRIFRDSRVVAERWSYPRAVVQDICILEAGDGVAVARKQAAHAREVVSFLRERTA